MTPHADDDMKWMHRALQLARAAGERGEIPIGAVAVKNGAVVGEGSNQREQLNSALSHAEMHAIAAACANMNAWRLHGCELFVTLEPCIMCAGAIQQARIGRVVFGAADSKAGALGSLYRINEDTRLNHRYVVEGGLLEEECRELLRQFFKSRRTSQMER